MSGLFKTAREAQPAREGPTTNERSGRGGDQHGAERQITRSYRESRHLSVAAVMEKASHSDLFFRGISGSGIIA